MIGRTLIPSYMETNHIDSLRHQLCDIIYNDYKGTTFFFNQMIEEKKEVLKKVTAFIENNPQLIEYKDNAQYWYPYEKVDSTKDLRLYADFYPNTDDEITYFCKEEQDSFDYSEYLYDPVKMIFFIMCRDIKKMDCESDSAKDIIQLNNQIFKVLIDVVGDPISYNNKNNIEHMEYYLKSHQDNYEKSSKDPYYDSNTQDMIKRDYDRLNDFIYILEDVFIFANQYSLDKKIAHQDDKQKQKVKV